MKLAELIKPVFYLYSLQADKNLSNFLFYDQFEERIFDKIHSQFKGKFKGEELAQAIIRSFIADEFMGFLAEIVSLSDIFSKIDYSAKEYFERFFIPSATAEELNELYSLIDSSIFYAEIRNSEEFLKVFPK